MTDSLLDPIESPELADGSTSPDPSDPMSPNPPEGVPDKFWNSSTGTLRAEALIKSYRELERKLGSPAHATAPASFDEYDLTAPSDLISPDEDINRRLHAAGFSNAQAQLVYDLAAERLAPMVSEIAAVFEAERQVQRLVEEFGGPERWQQASRQIASWGRTNLPEPVFDALVTTHDGIMAIHTMMNKDEPDLTRNESSATALLSESDLKALMNDPRYWRDRDADIVARVQSGFRRLYPE